MKKLVMPFAVLALASSSYAQEPPSNALAFGYYAVVGRGRDMIHEVPHTDLVEFGAWADIVTDTPTAERPALISAAMAEIKASGKRAIVNLSININWTPDQEAVTLAAIDAAAAGETVAYLLLADEVDWPAAYVSQRADEVRSLWAAQFPGLPAPPIGVTVTPPVGASSDMVVSSNLDFVNIEAYMESCQCAGPCCCGDDGPAAAKEVLGSLDDQAAHVPTSKFLLVTMQAYTRNGNFCPVEPNLVDVQAVTYAWAAARPRVRALVMFAYDRGSWDNPIGTRYQPAIKDEHIRLRSEESASPKSSSPPNTGPDPDGPGFWQLAAIYGTGELADALTTEWFHSTGGQEVLNRWHGGRGRRLLIHSAAVGFFAAADRYVLQRGSPRVARIARIVALAAKGLLSINNGYVAVTGKGGLFR